MIKNNNMAASLIKKIPFIVLGISLSLVFIVSLVGIYYYFFSKEVEGKKKGIKFLFYSLYGLLGIFIISFTSFLTTYFLKKQGMFNPPVVVEQTPPLVVDKNFPPPPKIIKIGEFYFSGPYALEKNYIITKPVQSFIYAIICKKEKNNYQAIYIGKIEIEDLKDKQVINLLKTKEYKCWLEKCGNQKDIFIAFLYLDENENIERKWQEINSQVNPKCFISAD